MDDWLKTLITPLSTLENAIEVIHQGGVRIALVVDSSNRLLGTITDGDIRRSLLKHKTMDVLVTNVMNAKPMTVSITDDRGTILSLMKRMNLFHVPIVDERNCIIGLEILHDIIDDVKHDNPVFLMAGGFGKRLSPLTNDTPKPLLHVGSKPILETILTQFIESGFHKFYISTHYKAEMLREHFGNGDRWGVSIQYLHEESPLGTAGALGLLPKNLSELPIIMMNGDLLTKVNFEHLLEFHNEQKNIATMCVCKYDIHVPYGVIEQDDGKIKNIVEKPTHNFFINAGIYVLNPTVRGFIDGNTHLDMPNLLKEQIMQGENVSMFPIHEYWLDIGRMEEYEHAHKIYGTEFTT